MPDAGEGWTLLRSVWIDAAPETVYAYLTDADKIARWCATEACTEPRIGGAYRAAVDPSHVLVGRFLELEPGRRVVYELAFDTGMPGCTMPPDVTVVSFELAPEAGGTRVAFEQRHIPVQIDREASTGWDVLLKRLVAAASGGDAGPMPDYPALHGKQG